MIKTKLLIVYRTDGFASRVKALLSVAIYARKYNIPVLYIWPYMERYQCPLDQTLQPEYYNYVYIPTSLKSHLIPDVNSLLGYFDSYKEKINYQKVGPDDAVLPILTEEYLKELGDNKIHYCYENLTQSVDSLMEEHEVITFVKVPHKLTRKDLNLPFDCLKLQPSFEQNVNNFLSENKERLGNGFVGVHVRTGDLLDDPREKIQKRVIPITNYFKVIDNLNKVIGDQPLLLCTEDDNTIKQFKDKYGDRVFMYPISGYGYSSVEVIIDAIHDMLCLSKANHLIMSNTSNFVLLAKHMGQVKHVHYVHKKMK